MQNHFQLDEPEKWHCCITSDIRNHQPLVVELTRQEPDDICWLFFPKLFYCEAPQGNEWDSADFSVALPQDALRYLRKFDALSRIDDRTLLRDYFVYYLDSSDGPVRIVSIGRGEPWNEAP
ncbi:MAG: hypothetical protein KC708_24530 [Anaerolineae bacterium]|nr:hypothetical protein [Anaerolineae bacterium]